VGERSAEVVVLGIEAIHPARLGNPCEVWKGVLGEAQDVFRAPAVGKSP
jgi:hypothetical protein